MATLAKAAGVGDLADLLGVDLRETKTDRAPEALPTSAPCRCLDAAGRRDPRVWAALPGRCERCGHWLADEIGAPDPHSDMEGLANLAADVERVREGLLEEATLDGVMDEDDYLHWLETRLRAVERSLDRSCGRAAR